MKPAAASRQLPLVRDALEPWCAAGATGVLRVLSPPGGTIYLSNGHIAYAECPNASGVNRLLTTSGRLSMEEFRAALSAGRSSGNIGVELTRPGLLVPTEVEVVFLAAIYGAVHFLFDAAAEVRFEMGTRHPLGTVVDLDLKTVGTEIDRRRRALREAWPDPAVDSLPVAPARRLDGHNVSLNALQWEIVVNSGRRRTPTDLARVLGRDSYATLLNARRLIRSGLLQLIRPPMGPSPKPAMAGDATADATPSTAARTARARTSPRRSGATARSSGDATKPDLRLPHRDGQPTPDWFDGDTAWSESTLVRIRDALQGLS